MSGPFGLVGIHALKHVEMERKVGLEPSKFMLNMEETIVMVKIKKIGSVQLSHVVSLLKSLDVCTRLHIVI